jgi:hypothetical protein
MNTEHEALYERIAAGPQVWDGELVKPLLEEAGKLDLGDHVRLRGNVFSTFGFGARSDPWPVGFTGTLIRATGCFFHVALHAIPVTLYAAHLDLAKIEAKHLAGLPATKPLRFDRKRGTVACGHCGKGDLVHVHLIEEMREVLGVEKGATLIRKDARLIDVAPERPRLVCLACDREYAVPEASRFIASP